jgi:hypothetical protein
MLIEDPTAFLRDFGKTVTFGSVSTLVIFDQPDMDVLSGHAQSTQYRILFPTGALAGLGNGSSVAMGAAMFKVLGTPNMLDDGLFSEARLERIS